jgi:hypothetical protein
MQNLTHMSVVYGHFRAWILPGRVGTTFRLNLNPFDSVLHFPAIGKLDLTPHCRAFVVDTANATIKTSLKVSGSREQLLSSHTAIADGHHHPTIIKEYRPCSATAIHWHQRLRSMFKRLDKTKKQRKNAHFPGEQQF